MNNLLSSVAGVFINFLLPSVDGVIDDVPAILSGWGFDELPYLLSSVDEENFELPNIISRLDYV